jgi:hypothetical protein
MTSSFAIFLDPIPRPRPRFGALLSDVAWPSRSMPLASSPCLLPPACRAPAGSSGPRLRHLVHRVVSKRAVEQSSHRCDPPRIRYPEPKPRQPAFTTGICECLRSEILRGDSARCRLAASLREPHLVRLTQIAALSPWRRPYQTPVQYEDISLADSSRPEYLPVRSVSWRAIK